MSGQTPHIVYEQESSKISPDLEIETDAESLDIVDPLADFIEKHGYKLVRNHEGEYVTVAEAIENCPPFRRLVLAMGEGALVLMAAQKDKEEVEKTDEAGEQKDEAEPDEAETAEQTQDESPREPDIHSEKEETQGGQATDISDGSLPEAAAPTSTEENPDGNSGIGASSAESTPLSSAKESDVSPVNPVRTSQISKTVTLNFAPQPIDKPQKKVPQFKAETPERVVAVNEEIEKPAVNTESDKPDTIEPETPPAAILESRPFERLIKSEPESTPVVSDIDEIEDSGKEPPVTGFIDAESETVEDNAAAELIGLKESAPEVLPPEKVEDESVNLAQNEVDQSFEMISSADWEEDSEVDALSEALLADEFLQVDTEHAMSHHLKLEAPEPLFELSLPVEEVEHNVQELAGRIEALDAEESRAVHDILDKIVVKFEEITASPNNIEDEEYAQAARDDKAEEMKELFIDLFDRVELDYTPELLESLTGLAMRGHMAEFTKAIEADTKNRTAVDRGTHEAINRLLAVVSRIKKAVLHAYSIGRSMLRLYSQQMTATA